MVAACETTAWESRWKAVTCRAAFPSSFSSLAFFSSFSLALLRLLARGTPAAASTRRRRYRAGTSGRTDTYTQTKPRGTSSLKHSFLAPDIKQLQTKHAIQGDRHAGPQRSIVSAAGLTVRRMRADAGIPPCSPAPLITAEAATPRGRTLCRIARSRVCDLSASLDHRPRRTPAGLHGFDTHAPPRLHKRTVAFSFVAAATSLPFSAHAHLLRNCLSHRPPPPTHTHARVNPSPTHAPPVAKLTYRPLAGGRTSARFLFVVVYVCLTAPRAPLRRRPSSYRTHAK